MCALLYLSKIQYLYTSVGGVVQSKYCGVTHICIDLMARPLTNKDGDASTYASEYMDIYFSVGHIQEIIESIALAE